MLNARLPVPRCRVSLSVWFSDRSSLELSVLSRSPLREGLLPAKRSAAWQTLAGCPNDSQTRTAAASLAVSSRLLREAASDEIRADSRYINKRPVRPEAAVPKSAQLLRVPKC